jgi:hypothetical protein
MFLKVLTELPLDFEKVRAMLLGQSGAWLPDRLAAAAAERERLVAEAGLDAGAPRGQPAHVHLGEPVQIDRLVVLPFSVRVDGRRLLASLDGSLDAAWLGPDRTHLALTASYEPLAWSGGRARDGVLLHRVAETLGCRLLNSVADGMVVRSAASVRGALTV